MRLDHFLNRSTHMSTNLTLKAPRPSLARLPFLAALYPPVAMILWFCSVALLFAMHIRLTSVTSLLVIAVYAGTFLMFPAILLAIVLGLMALVQGIRPRPTIALRGTAVGDKMVGQFVLALLILFDILLLAGLTTLS
jgi:hypothetical protein